MLTGSWATAGGTSLPRSCTPFSGDPRVAAIELRWEPCALGGQGRAYRAAEACMACPAHRVRDGQRHADQVQLVLGSQRIVHHPLQKAAQQAAEH